ncbi:MAG: acyl-CoA desaturase [Actinobacteria bacterium]|nr:acyl-CoA desaturase [Actinomycetota bacterium]
MSAALTAAGGSPPAGGPQPVLDGRRTAFQHTMIYVFVAGPMVALVAAVPLAWGWGVGWHDLGLLAAFYVLAVLGITVGFHRHFTHSAFKARPWLRVTMAIIGSLAVQGNVLNWVADHRRHHAFSDREGDPHSPLYGFWHAHMGWMFRPPEVSNERYAPDILADRDLRMVNALFPVFCVLTLAIPFGLGWLLGGSFATAWSGLLWAGVIRIGLLHHMTWSINSICHMFGSRPFKTGDQSGNVAALAVFSMGESWHNAHHAFPASARHGVDRFQLDSSAAVIRTFERAGWVSDVRWPDAERVASKRL